MSLGPVLDAALAAQAACEGIRLEFCVIGDVALQRWGKPRFTAGADLSVLVEPGQERQGLKLDLDLIRTELTPLLEAKEQPELAEMLEQRIQRHVI